MPANSMTMPSVLSFARTLLVRRAAQYLACLCWALPVLSACDGLPAENTKLKERVVQAIRAIEARPVGDTLLIDMRTVADFPWDTLYMFTSTAPVDFISEDIGTEWPGTENIHEDDNLLVFMHRGRIADYVCFRGFDDQNEPPFVKFTGYFNRGQLFTPATARFAVMRDKRPPHLIEVFDPYQRKSIHRPHSDIGKIPF